MAGAARPSPAPGTLPAEPDARRLRELITPEGVDLRVEIADASQRAGAFLIDALILFVGMIVVFIVVGFTLGAFAAAGQKQAFEMAGIFVLLIGFFARNFYFIAFELLPGAATPGKRMLGLRVASRNGGRLDGDAIFARNAMRELEVFLPLSFMFSGAAAGHVDAWLNVIGLTWSAIFMLFPLFNRDRLRVGDLVAGTWVVRAPKRRLNIDLSREVTATMGGFDFTPDQLNAYGIKELYVLEEVLRRRDRRTLAAVAERIRKKIGWAQTQSEQDLAFLNAYYTGLRGRLESRLLFGRRRVDKFDKD
ncbi:MAG: RDD family protein [Caulobacteraceae bacterium]